MKIRSLFGAITMFLGLSCPAFAATLSEVAPPLSGIEIYHKAPLALSGYLGKTVLLNFWASWCSPCRHSLIQLNALQEKFNDKDFKVLAVNLDKDPQDALKFLSKIKMQYPVLMHVSSAQIKAYSVQGFPISYLINKKGIIVKRFVDFKPNNIAKIKDYLQNGNQTTSLGNIQDNPITNQ